MAKPVQKPQIASTDVNLPNTGQPNKSQPTGTLLTVGYDKGQKPAAEEYNWLWDNTRDWIDYFEEKTETVATTAVAGIVELATQPETDAGTAGKVVTADTLHARVATETLTGLVEKATTAEAQAGTANKYPDAAGVIAAFDNKLAGYNVNTRHDEFTGDVDTILYNSTYEVTSASTNTPAEISGSFCFITTTMAFSSTNFGSQFLVTMDALRPRSFIRQRNVTWSAWTELTSLSTVYPVGSIYMNAGVATNPATLLGFGTWTSFGAGRVLVGLDGGDVDFDTLQETGGEKTHVLTTTEMPSHRHTQSAVNTGTGGQQGVQQANQVNNATGGFTDYEGGGLAHNNVQPYITVAMWLRTA